MNVSVLITIIIYWDAYDDLLIHHHLTSTHPRLGSAAAQEP